MTISNQRGNLEILQPAVTIDQAQILSEIYEQSYAPGALHCDEETIYEGRESFNRKIRILRNSDITNLKVDAVVNPVQSELTKPPVGLCQQMFYKGGPTLKQACLEYGNCPLGEAFITEGYELPAGHVIHTAGPSPKCRLKYAERLEYLRQSYRSSLNIVKEQEFLSVGIPCLGTGGGGIHLKDAVEVAVTTVRDWLEAGNNKIEHLVFCLVDENQFEAFMKELTKCFPTGKDAAGIDLEQLSPVPSTILDPPAWIQRTSICCLKYSATAKRKINYRFHNIINHCCSELSSLNSEIDRYSDSAVFCLTSDKVYRSIILHSHEINLIEIQILKFSHDHTGVEQQIKLKLYSALKDYLETYLENVTPFEVLIRCEKSTWRSENGLWPITVLQTVGTDEVPCDHGNDMVNTHLINLRQLQNQWPVLEVMEPPQGAGAEGGRHVAGREPTENWDSMTIPDDSLESTRTKEFAASNHPTSQKHYATSRNSVTSSMSGPSRIFSRFQSLFSFNSGSMNSATNSKTAIKTDVKNTTLNQDAAKSSQTIQSNQAMQSQAAALSTDRRTTLPYGESRNICEPPDGTVEELATNVVEYPTNDLKATLPGFGRSSSVEVDITSIISSDSNSGKSSSGDEMEPAKHRKEKGGILGERSFSSKRPTDKDLLEIAEALGCRHEELGIRLGLTQSTIERIKGENPFNIKMQGFKILRSWFCKKRSFASLEKLFDEMEQCDMGIYDLRMKFYKIQY